MVSLNPCTDALLVELGDPAQIAALSSYSSTPGQSSLPLTVARRFPSTRGTMEEVLAARPSVVVSGGFTPPATAQAYRRMGVRLVELGIASTVEESDAQIRQMAALLGHRQRGEALIARIHTALAQAAPPAGQAAVPTLVWHGGGLVSGPHTLISDVMARVGLAPLSATKGLSQAQYLPLEAVVADPPALVLAVAHSGQGTDGRRSGARAISHPVLDRLPHTRRAELDPSLEYCGGPTIIALAQRLAQIRQDLPQEHP
ncbi:ABC transporter substrate-binding protein [Novosphingobium umbonatum]|uniref:ABC transporter substrate-binding protein n=1 Tax=Novosphingobium umbonatum TaxID=1908524 RepID=UPI001FE279A1|nr:ABC transporter substrate-binding protein [Novosphingobium umbonatum]